MADAKENEILMEIAVGKGVMRKLPSYLRNGQKETCERTVAEEVLFD